MFFPAAPKCAHQYVQNAWEWDKHDLKVSRDPAGCLALHSGREHEKDPLLGGNLWERRTACSSACKLPSYFHNHEERMAPV